MDQVQEQQQVVLEVKDLRTHFFMRWGVVKAVDGVSFSLRRGEVLGLVGESGCGKTVTCLSLLRLEPRPAARIVGGQILLNGEDLLQKTEKEMRHVRGKSISMILQDPMTSLNPVYTIGFQVAEPFQLRQRLRGDALWHKVKEVLELVRISSPETRLKNYPHQLSGGMRQRVVGAISVSCRPAVLIADEATTYLDVTIQAQYLRLLKDIQQATRMSLIFVTHDLGIVAQMCDRIAVMYAGKIVETGSVMEIFDQPLHPYTQALLGAVTQMEKKGTRLFTIGGQPPVPHDLPAGCYFQPRCKQTEGKCQSSFPPTVEVSPGHLVTCWRET